MAEHSDFDETGAQKRRVRQSVQAARDAMTADQLAEARDGLTEQLSTLVSARGARSISCYLPVQAEPDTRGFLSWAREQGIEVFLPSAREDGLLDWIRDTGEGTVTGPFGIPEPLGDHLSPLAVCSVDLMLVPACAVDRAGVRLGWGRGYFDRNLGSMDNRPPVFAIVNEPEIFDALPSEVDDIPVTGAVTPSRIVYLGR